MHNCLRRIKDFLLRAKEDMIMADYINPERWLICGRNLKKLVKNNPVYNTQEKFAEAMDVDVRTVRRWYADGVKSLFIVRKASIILNIPDTEILFG